MIVSWNFFILQYFLILVLVKAIKASTWASPEQEALDEVNDVKLLKAVYQSMTDYWLRRMTSGHRKKRASSIVCYGDLGCFEDTGPFGYIDMLPSSPEEVSTKFFLYSGNSRGDVPIMEVPYFNMSKLWNKTQDTFNVTAPTKIIVHGFGSSCTHVWVYEMRSALMSVEDCNVICVDWESGAVMPNYVRAAANTRLVGKQVAMLVRGFIDKGLSLDKVHLIGFSLGAHVAGFAGAELKNVSRITGLDPAGPLFESQDPKARLDETDATFVDVIHSNGENLILGGLGSWQPMGHVDFYPNGGRMQKGCTNLFVGAVSDIIWSASDIEGRSLCNHRRAYKFFTDSVSPRCHFPAFPCESYEKFIDGKCFPCTPNQDCGSMGYYADKSSARGSLYLITREEEPFCAHQYYISVESSPSKLPVLSYGKIQITLIGDNNINETFTMTNKDDEELGVGTALSRIVVPHPALDPQAVEIVYTAYSGWISSGLKKWSIDKVKISDSYGKSLSHCKKDLILESKLPITLKLFPGNCNLPRDPDDASEEIDPFFIGDSSKRVEKPSTTTSTTSTTSSTTTTPKSLVTEDSGLVVDGFPAYNNKKEYYELVGNDTESVEANKIVIESIVPLVSVQSPEKNYTMKIIRKQEITEPVLQPKSSGKNMKDEIDEPVLKAIEKIDIVEKTTEAAPIMIKKSSIKPRGINLGTYGTNDQNRVESNFSDFWTIPQELYPPPLGRGHSWDTPKKFSGPLRLIFPGSEKHERNDYSPKTLQSKMISYDKLLKGKADSKLPQRFYFSSSNQFSDYPKNEDGSITVQLLPPYLASVFKQAEQYAKNSFFNPLEFFNKSRGKSFKNHTELEDLKKSESKQNFENLASPRSMEDSSKKFLPMIYDYIGRGFDSVKSLFSFFQSRETGSDFSATETTVKNEIDRMTGNETRKIEKEETEMSTTTDKFIPLNSDSVSDFF